MSEFVPENGPEEELSEEAQEFINVIASSAVEGVRFSLKMVKELMAVTDEISEEEEGRIILRLVELGVLKKKVNGEK